MLDDNLRGLMDRVSTDAKNNIAWRKDTEAVYEDAVDEASRTVADVLANFKKKVLKFQEAQTGKESKLQVMRVLKALNAGEED